MAIDTLALDLKHDFYKGNQRDAAGEELKDTDSSGDLHAGNKLRIHTTGDIVVNSEIQNIGSIELESDQSITNNNSLMSAKDITLIAGTDITNAENSLLWAMESVNIDAKNGTFVNQYNGNVLSNDTMQITARDVINNSGTIRSLGDMNIDALHVTNNAVYEGGTWENGPIVQSDEGWFVWYDGVFNLTQNQAKNQALVTYILI